MCHAVRLLQALSLPALTGMLWQVLRRRQLLLVSHALLHCLCGSELSAPHVLGMQVWHRVWHSDSVDVLRGGH